MKEIILITDNSDEDDCPLCPFKACSQLCTIKKHSNFSCECASGYIMLHETNHSFCEAKGAHVLPILRFETSVAEALC